MTTCNRFMKSCARATWTIEAVYRADGHLCCHSTESTTTPVYLVDAFVDYGPLIAATNSKRLSSCYAQP